MVADFQQGGDANAVVGGSGAGRGAVVMRIEKQGRSTAAGQDSDDVANPAATDRARLGEAAAVHRFVDFGPEADGGDFGHQPPPDCVVCRAVNRMRALVAEDPLQPRQRARRVELP